MRENGLRALGGLAQRLASGIAKGRRASIARLRADWPAIVGPDLARVSRPEALLASHGRSGKALRLRVPLSLALAVAAIALAPIAADVPAAGPLRPLLAYVTPQAGSLFPLAPWSGHVFFGLTR